MPSHTEILSISSILIINKDEIIRLWGCEITMIISADRPNTTGRSCVSNRLTLGYVIWRVRATWTWSSEQSVAFSVDVASSKGSPLHTTGHVCVCIISSSWPHSSKDKWGVRSQHCTKECQGTTGLLLDSMRSSTRCPNASRQPLQGAHSTWTVLSSLAEQKRW